MKSAFKILSLIFFVTILFSCSNKETNGHQKRTIKIGMVTFPGYAPLYLAKEKKYFGDLNVKLVRIEGIGDLRAALNSGKIDIYAATFDIFESIEKTAPPGIAFLAIDESHGADGLVVSSEINKLSDLKGKIVGAEPGLPPYFILEYLLNKVNLTLKDVVFKDISSQDAGNAFVAGKLDAAGTYEPFLSKSVELRKGAKILVSSKDTPGLIVDLLFSSEKLVKNDPEVLKTISNGWFKAVNYWKYNENKAVKIMAKSFGVSPKEFSDIKSGIKWLSLDDNKVYFNSRNNNNVFDTFNLVGNILKANNKNNFKVLAKDKITTLIIHLF